jgi:hypothetical protein
MSLNSVYWERVLGAVLFRANGQIDRQTDRQTGVTKLTIAFLSFAIASQNFVLRR